VESLAVNAIRKHFPGVEVLKGISFALQQGRIYGLVGENGAGKSTLVKILMGLFPPDAGDISLQGQKVQIKDPQQARYDFGIDAVFQEHALIPQMSIAENVFLDRLESFYRQGIINNNLLETSAREAIGKVGLNLEVSTHVQEISEAEKSLIEFSKALLHDPKILILDEMTAPLESGAVLELFDLLKDLKQSGKTVIFISHRLQEVLTICDEVFVLKDGNLEGIIDNTQKNDLASTRKKIVRMMTGTEKGLHFPPKIEVMSDRKVILSLKGIRNGSLCDINLNVHEGEIVALAGLRGQGQSILLRAIAGLIPHVEGEIFLCGAPMRCRNPYDPIKCGVFYVSDQRDEEELWLSHDVWLNLSLTSIAARTSFGIIRTKYDSSVIQDMVSSLRIQTPNLRKIVQQLSGGNRQKIVLGKYLLAQPKILLMDQPTIGLDVGAKVEIYDLLRNLASQGIPTLAVLTDLEEVVNLPDRILVIHEGKVVREFSGEKVDEEELVDSYYG
jgi:ABC-type sugar transport system ATPase subunit